MNFANDLRLRFSLVVLVVVMLCGCVHNVPLAVDPAKDMIQALPKTKKIPVKVGMYFSEDLKTYIYKQQKMGMTFQMKVGEYLPPIAISMGTAMFEEVIPVNSIPPYNGGYNPDVEAIVVPEILYSYGNAVGTLSGYIEGKVLMRITAYDLGGKVLWQDQAMGESRSREMSFVGTFLGGMEEVGKTGYDAAFKGAVKIIKDFNARPPKELYSLLDIKGVAKIRNARNISDFDIFQNYYKKGEFQYDHKNYYQALYSFEKALKLNPADQSTLMFIGMCYTYTGAKYKALEKFKSVVDLAPKSKDATDAKEWIKLLKEPLKIGILNSTADGDHGLNKELISQALLDSNMYELIDVANIRPPASTKSQKEWKDFLARCAQKDIKVVIINDIETFASKVNIEQAPSGDFATEYLVKISSLAYATKKKAIKAAIKITERTSTIREKNLADVIAIKTQLLKSAADKLVLRLIENDVY